MKSLKMKNQYKASQYNLSMQQVDKIINSSRNIRDKLIIESLYFPALRRFEVAKLDIRDINFNTGDITVIGKGNKRAEIPVGSVFPQYITDLRLFIGNRKEGFVFLSNRGNKIDVMRINQIVEETANLANIKHPAGKMRVNPHLFRHSLARHLKDLRMPVEFIQNYLRHSSMKTTMDTYGTLGLTEMRQIALERRGIVNNNQLI